MLKVKWSYKMIKTCLVATTLRSKESLWNGSQSRNTVCFACQTKLHRLPLPSYFLQPSSPTSLLAQDAAPEYQTVSDDLLGLRLFLFAVLCAAAWLSSERFRSSIRPRGDEGFTGLH